MKIYAIRDESSNEQKDLAYLLYFEVNKCFYIELPDNADQWETPLLLSSFAKKGETTVYSYWSRLWVQQRIIPSDRQNLGQILKDNNLTEYDEFQLLMLGMGRCAQDEYYLVPMDESQLPDQIKKRLLKKIEDIVTLDNFALLVFFRDGVIKKCNLKEYFEENEKFNVILNNEHHFLNTKLQPGGYGVEWDVNLGISDSQLYDIGENVPLTASDFQNFAVQRVVNVAEAAEILECSRQNIDYLSKAGKLHPIKLSGKNTLYLKSEILKRSW